MDKVTISCTYLLAICCMSASQSVVRPGGNYDGGFPWPANPRSPRPRMSGLPQYCVDFHGNSVASGQMYHMYVGCNWCRCDENGRPTECTFRACSPGAAPFHRNNN